MGSFSLLQAYLWEIGLLTKLGCMLGRLSALRRPHSPSYLSATPSKDLLRGWPNMSFFPACSFSPNGLSDLWTYSSRHPLLENLWWLGCPYDCNGRSIREDTNGGRKREKVIRVQRLEIEYMNSLARFRLVVQMKMADFPRTYLSPAQHLEAENQAWSWST